MKRNYVRGVAALVLATLLTLTAAPVAAAAARDHRGGNLPSAVVRIIKQVQKLFGVRIQSDLPQPPRPDPGD